MKKIVTLFVVLVFLLAACTDTSQSESETAGTNTSQSDTPDEIKVEAVRYNAQLTEQTVQPLNSEFVQGNNDFGFSIARTLYTAEENLAISPVSIELALAMTRVGALGETANEMAQVLGLDNMTDEQIIGNFKSLMWRANTGGMEAANSIWLGVKYTFDEAFLNTCTNDFMADAMPLIIPGAMEQINAWASEKTHGTIDSILTEEPDPNTQIILCNALYYLGDWEVPFDAYATSIQDFQTPSGTIEAPFMYSDRYVPYTRNEIFSMISLNFKGEPGEGKYAMAFLLPNEGTQVSDMLSSLTSEMFLSSLGAMTEQEVFIRIPKFEYSFYASLEETLGKLGMGQAFDIADFSAMTQEPNDLYIVNVFHKCYIRIDELGAEASAVTEVEASERIAPEDPPEFYADRPFVFAIYSLEDGAIAFLGVVNNPTME